MEILERAIGRAEQIRDALAAEVARSREQRVLIRNMDADGLVKRAAERAQFNQLTAALQQVLGEALGEAGHALGLREITLEAISFRAPAQGARLGAVLGEVRALASALAELDGLNRMLGQRALSYVRAHLTVLSPKPAAYDRRGGAPADGETRASRVVRVA